MSVRCAYEWMGRAERNRAKSLIERPKSSSKRATSGMLRGKSHGQAIWEAGPWSGPESWPVVSLTAHVPYAG